MRLHRNWDVERLFEKTKKGGNENGKPTTL